MDRSGVLQSEFLARFGEPSRIVLLAYDTNSNRHIGMVLAANLGTLPIIDALAFGLEPGFVHPARNRVDADAKRENGEGMNDVRGGHLELNDFSNRHNRYVIDRKLADITRLQVGGLDHLGIEFEAAALILGICISPVPLLAGRLHRYVRRWHGQLMGEQTKRWNCDHNEDHDRGHRPRYFKTSMMSCRRRSRVRLFVEPENDVGKQA